MPFINPYASGYIGKRDIYENHRKYDEATQLRVLGKDDYYDFKVKQMIVKEGRTEAVRKKAIKLAASLGIQGSMKTGKLIARQFGNTGKSLLTAAQKAKISKIANKLGGVVKMYGNVVSAYQITNSIVEAIRGGKSPEQAIKEIGDVLIPIPGYLDLFIATMKRRPKMSEYRKELFGNQEHSSWFGR